jgi:hypothetical protein
MVTMVCGRFLSSKFRRVNSEMVQSLCFSLLLIGISNQSFGQILGPSTQSSAQSPRQSTLKPNTRSSFSSLSSVYMAEMFRAAALASPPANGSLSDLVAASGPSPFQVKVPLSTSRCRSIRQPSIHAHRQASPFLVLPFGRRRMVRVRADYILGLYPW